MNTITFFAVLANISSPTAATVLEQDITSRLECNNRAAVLSDRHPDVGCAAFDKDGNEVRSTDGGEVRYIVPTGPAVPYQNHFLIEVR